MSGVGIISIFGFYTSFLTAAPTDSPFLAFVIISPTIMALTATYSILSAAFPRSGADYVYNSRILNAPIAVMTDFLYMSILAGTMAPLGILSINFIQDMFQVEGLATGNAAYTSIASTLGQPLVVFTVTTIMVIITLLFLVGRLRTFARLNLVVVAANILLFLVVLAIVGATSTATYQTEFANLFHVSYQKIISTAQSAGMGSTGGSGISWYGSSTLIYWATGAFLPTFVAGEMKKPGKSLVGATLLAQLVMIAFYVLAGLIAFTTFGSLFTYSESYLVAHAMLPFPTTTGNLLYLMAPAIGNPALIAIIYVFFAAGGFMVGALTMGLSTRKFLAWSFDRLIPARFADVSPRFNSPIFSSIVIGIIAEFFVALVVYGPGLYAVVSGLGVLALSVVWGVSGISAVVLPLRKRLFESTPGWVQRKVAGIPVVSMIGGFLLISLEAFLTVGQLIPTVQGGLPVYPTIWTISTMIVGLVLYFAAKAYRRRDGIDLALVYKEIPPE